MDDENSFTIYDATNVGKRTCGTCQLCCKILPVKTLDKPGWTKCAHQRVGKGCMVYHKLLMVSPECQLWSCRWLTGQDTAGMARPDRSHYVIDLMPDMIAMGNDAGLQDYMVLQVWLDPAFPHARHDPALRAWIERRAIEDGMPTIIRTGDDKAVVVVAPCLSADGQWHERTIDLSRSTGSGNRFVDKLAQGAFR